MQINLDNISTQEPQFTKQKHNSTIVIDNGTFNLKAGFISNQPSVIFRNRIYKNKQGFLLTDTQSSLRSMFERDLLINVEILEATLDIVFDHTGTCENLIFTTVVDIPKLFLGPVISLLFEVYKFKKIQIGVDAFYSYLYNVKENERGKQKIFFDEIENIENDIDNNNLEILNNITEKCILADKKNIKEEEKTDENNKNDNFISNNKTDKCLSADKKNIKEEEKTDDENIKKFKYDMLNSKKNIDSHVEFNNKNLSEKKTVNETDLIISLSHYNTLVYIVQNEKIVKYYKLPFGGLLASEYLQMLLTSKYSDFNFKINLRESEYLLKNLKVALDFNKESNDIYERLKTCNAEFGLTSKSIKQIQDSLTQKPKEKRNLPKVFKKEELQESQNLFESDLFDEESNFENEKNNFENEKSENKNLNKKEKNNPENNSKEINEMEEESESNSKFEDIQEKNVILQDENENLTVKMSEREKIYFYMNIPDDKLSPEKLKEKRKYKMIFYSTLYRFKQRIEKQLKKIILNIENLEEEYEKTENIDKYLDKIKEKLKKVKKEIKTRERIKRDVKNKRSKEFMVLQNVNHGKMLLEEDENILKSIEEANDEEIDLILGMDYQKYYNIINAYDPDFLIDLNPINVMKNDFTNFNADLELLKVSEILFEPSIIGIQQPGLKEIFNELRNERIKNVLICGGFANIKNLKERIEQELKYCIFYNEFNIKIADDLVFDQFEGAKFCDAFKTFTIEEFNNFGIEQLLKDENVFLN